MPNVTQSCVFAGILLSTLIFLVKYTSKNNKDREDKYLKILAEKEDRITQRENEYIRIMVNILSELNTDNKIAHRMTKEDLKVLLTKIDYLIHKAERIHDEEKN